MCDGGEGGGGGILGRVWCVTVEDMLTTCWGGCGV